MSIDFIRTNSMDTDLLTLASIIFMSIFLAWASLIEMLLISGSLYCRDLIGLTSMIWTSKNAADNKIASLSYKPYACFRRDIKDLSYIIIRYKEVYLWLLSMIHVPLICKLTGTACTRLPSTFSHTQAETTPVRDASTLDKLCLKYE